MIKRTLIVMIVLMAILLALGTWVKFREEPPKVEIPQPLSEVIEVKVDPPPIVIPPEVIEANEINQGITGLTCDKLKILVWENGFKYRLRGDLFYVKDKKFSMIIRSLFGTEVELGSNLNHFWFWSRRNPDPGLFYAKHEDYYRTRLKTPFNPIAMMRSLGVDVIDISKPELIKVNENDITIIRKDRNALGKDILVTTFLDKNTKRITSILTTDMDMNPLISAVIKEYEGILPKKIYYKWFEEDRAMEIELIKPEIIIDDDVEPDVWKIPDLHPQIDMGND